ncbi:hypothetical protein ASF53_11905 [Methylobacterium sp. Leaf123]|nr:hypothetical protein ASF53_11905 [Methylobacterium sp. Leaf123]
MSPCILSPPTESGSTRGRHTFDRRTLTVQTVAGTNPTRDALAVIVGEYTRRTRQIACDLLEIMHPRETMADATPP